MTDSPPIDYKIAFEELNTLNSLFSKHRSMDLPALNPSLFRVVSSDEPSYVIIEGLRSGLYYLSIQSVRNMYSSSYTVFQPVTPTERTITEWVKA
jgi:hypothetical protein